MKAAIRSKYGSPEVLRVAEVAIPVPRHNELLVRVYASTVNRTDCGILSAKPFIMRFFTGLFRPKLLSTGTDFAGKIESVGRNVSGFKPGERVWGFLDNGIGSHAEFIVIPENGPLLTIPDGINYNVAAASAEGVHYAYNFINKIKFFPGVQVLVNGATGAIGSAAVQLLKYFGAYVTAVCDTSHIASVKSMGADRVISYTEEDFTKDPHKYHYVFDAVGKSTFAKCKGLLHPGGVYLSSELGPGAQNLYLPLITKLFGTKRVKFPFPSNIKRSLTLVRKLLEEKKFTPLIDKTYTLNEIRDAFNYVASGQKIGNVILIIS